MVWLLFGLAIWFAAHLFKRLAPDARARLTERFGEGSKGIVAIVLVISVILMVIGYRRADIVPVYDPFPAAGHINNLLMLIAFMLFGVGAVGGWLSRRMRHPMLIGMKTWAIAHLLVNGDLASIVLFGSMLAWAVVEVIVINRTSPAWAPDREARPGKRDLGLVVAWLVIFVVVAAVHIWLGHNPFLGDY